MHTLLQCMTKERLRTSGLSLIEVLLAAALFAIVVTTFTGALLYGQESAVLAGARARAVLIASEGIEAVRSMRDSDFANLANGTHGLALMGGVWTLTGSSDVTDQFTRTITIADAGTSRKSITSTVTWQQNAQRIGTVVLQTELTDWKTPKALGLCSNQASNFSVDTSGASLGVGNRELQGIVVENTSVECNVELAAITVTWTNVLRTLDRIRVLPKFEWTGSVSSGSVADVDDTVFANADGPIETRYRFSGNMKNNVFVITFTFSDNTTKTVINIAP